MVEVTERLAELGIELPPAQPAHGHHTPVLLDGDLVFMSSVTASMGDPPRLAFPGHLGSSLSVEEGRLAARATMISLLGNLNGTLGDLDRVKRFLKLTGYVAVAPGFTNAHFVVGGASDLLAELFGDEMVPARTVVGVCELPAGASIVLDAIVRLKS